MYFYAIQITEMNFRVGKNGGQKKKLNLKSCQDYAPNGPY